MEAAFTLDRSGTWESSARCRTAADADIFFSPGATQEVRAKAVCRSCPVRWECLAYALANRVDHGVWGGLSDRERRRLLSRAHTPEWSPSAAAQAAS